ncbi:stationary phase survival protein SurE [Pedobacter boryungensis]|uniref:Stationary phase survival protein SurE n=1 Tax=Pedobacter boryungensis TaxID=869962 RepID=A0ABX2DJ15_9SPHI|nr:stationary phase survival protein SurE [Pedobacter boryungensis]NQX33124.1 stationary phase survival protein SurE [Pedobacter boryungensis]
MNKRIDAIKDTVWNGIAIGFIVPIIPGVLVWYLMQRVTALHHADLLLIGCVAINALLMNLFFKINKDNIARGIISITFLWAFAFFFYKV